jgi:membrane fusion protein, multidrug efflux system
MSHRSLVALCCGCLILAGVTSGCAKQAKGKSDAAELPVVPVSRLVKRQITDYVDFTGQTSAVATVDIRARVTGFLIKNPFKDGAEVKKGDLLFEIDPRPYQAQFDQAQGQVNLYQAQLKLAKTTYARDKAIASSGGAGAISQQQLDQDAAAVEEAQARVKAFQASLEVYKLNLDFTKVLSPISGQVSRSYLSQGNLINQDQTLLTTVVALDPMNAYFEMDEATYLRIKNGIIEGIVQPPQDGQLVVQMGLQGEEGYPHQGKINFVNNQVNSATGSITFRGVFDNPVVFQPATGASILGLLGSPLGPNWLLPLGGLARPGARLLTPGMFVRVRLPIGEPHPALLVIDRAIQSDQGLKYVYVLDAENKVQYRRVTTEALQEDGLRAIQGVKPDQWVVVGGLQQVRPRMQVRREEVLMPSLGAAAPGEPKAPDGKE